MYSLVSIARKNLFQDKRRFFITILGISTSLLLIFIGLGMNFGIINGMLTVVNYSKADIWIINEGNSDLVQEISEVDENIIHGVKQIEGIVEVQSVVYRTVVLEKNNLRLPVIVISINTSDDMICPSKLITGNILNLTENNTIILDKSAELKFGKIILGQTFTMNNQSQEIVGITKGDKSFIYPLVFTSHENAKKICLMSENRTSYIMLQITDVASLASILDELSLIPGIDALTSKQLKPNTILYMQFSSGMGLGTFTFALVGLFVAIVIISLTTYTMTMEKVPEYGTL